MSDAPSRPVPAPNSIALSEEATGRIAILAVAGRLDTRTAEQFGTRLGQLLHPALAQPHLLIDLSHLMYIGSAGLRALLVGAKEAASAGGWLALCGATAPIKEVIEIAGLETAFRSFPSRAAALAELAAP